MTKKIIIGTGILFLIAFVAICRPVPIISEENALTEKGIVSSIYEGGVNDIIFTVEGSNRKFYINRGLEQGLNLYTLNKTLIGEEVTFKYPDYWTPLDWKKTSRHVSKVEHNNTVVFNEFVR